VLIATAAIATEVALTVQLATTVMLYEVLGLRPGSVMGDAAPGVVTATPPAVDVAVTV
jgi:hypothetical protein